VSMPAVHVCMHGGAERQNHQLERADTLRHDGQRLTPIKKMQKCRIAI
jgi:hypothetical protein